MTWVPLIPLLPLIAAVVMLLLPRAGRDRMLWLPVTAIAVSLVASLSAFAHVWPGGHAEEPLYHATWAFAVLDGTPLTFGFLLDPVSAAMLVVVTLVGLAVQVYSLGYMHRDERRGWYFTVLSLFTAAMLTLVLADGFLLLFVAWEVMGLCSYLLIGFWHTEEGPSRASMKAFLTTRVGDIGFMIGLAVMYVAAGGFTYEQVLGSLSGWAPGVATAVALLLLFGAMGKSAQVPLHVWLPDAMAGPTPASALIHAATMVAAGVYLVARALPIFEASGVALTVALVIGAVTALLAGLLAAVQHDIKKVLAYSTISQLGYMFIALGAGSLVAGTYHLVTHAFFKSLLFLGAGVIIHAAHTQDMREMGGLARRMPWTTAAFTPGALALAGVFPFSGFWSKDEILAVLLHEHHYVVFGIALLSAFVTAFYVARLWFRVFTGHCCTPDAREGHAEMIAPMLVLAAITTFIGAGSVAFANFLGHEGAWPDPAIAALSTGVAVAGLAVGYWAYGRRSVVLNTRSLKQRAGYAYDALAMKLYFDITYERLFIRPYRVLATQLAVFDLRVLDGVVNGVAEGWRRLSSASWSFDGRAIDGAVNGLAAGVRAAGRGARRVQVGRVQSYQRWVVAGLLVLILVVLLKGA